MKLLLALCVIFLICKTGQAVLGFDFSRYQGAVNVSTFQCMKKEGNEFMIIQAWGGSHMINPYYVQNYKNAKAAGISQIDIYAFACNNCSNNQPQTVITAIKASLPAGFDGTLWIDVEPCNGCWLSPDVNLKYIDTLAQTALSAGFKVGVYSSLNSWSGVVGSYEATTPLIKSLKLWYAHYDFNPSFNDTKYYQFGGFAPPVMKQYGNAGKECNLAHDYNWYPDPHAEEFNDSADDIIFA